MDRNGRVHHGWGNGAAQRALAGGADRAALMAKRAAENGSFLLHEAQDPDGYAVFGRFPKGMLREVLRLRLLGDVRRDEILHVCSGTLSEKWTVDVRAGAAPRSEEEREVRRHVQADGAALPFRDSSFAAVLIDPPYSDAYARALYGTENPRPSWLLREAARVVVPEGRIGLLHVAIPFAPPGCFLVRVWPVSTGVGFRIRALTIFAKRQAALFAEPVEFEEIDDDSPAVNEFTGEIEEGDCDDD